MKAEGLLLNALEITGNLIKSNNFEENNVGSVRAESLRIFIDVLEVMGNRDRQIQDLRSQLRNILENTPSWSDFKIAFLYQKMNKEDI